MFICLHVRMYVLSLNLCVSLSIVERMNSQKKKIITKTAEWKRKDIQFWKKSYCKLPNFRISLLKQKHNPSKASLRNKTTHFRLTDARVIHLILSNDLPNHSRFFSKDFLRIALLNCLRHVEGRKCKQFLFSLSTGLFSSFLFFCLLFFQFSL